MTDPGLCQVVPGACRLTSRGVPGKTAAEHLAEQPSITCAHYANKNIIKNKKFQRVPYVRAYEALLAEGARNERPPRLNTQIRIARARGTGTHA